MFNVKEDNTWQSTDEQKVHRKLTNRKCLVALHFSQYVKERIANSRSCPELQCKGTYIGILKARKKAA